MRKSLIGALITVILVVFAACSGNAEKESSAENGETKQGQVIRVGYQKGNTLHILKESGFLDEMAQ